MTKPTKPRAEANGRAELLRELSLEMEDLAQDLYDKRDAIRADDDAHWNDLNGRAMALTTFGATLRRRANRLDPQAPRARRKR